MYYRRRIEQLREIRQQLATIANEARDCARELKEARQPDLSGALESIRGNVITLLAKGATVPIEPDFLPWVLQRIDGVLPREGA